MEIRSRIHELLRHSLLERFESPGIVVVGATSYWGALPDEAKPLQFQLQRDARRWFDLIAQLVADRGDGFVDQARQIREFCESVINQDRGMWEPGLHEVARRLSHNLDELLVSLKGLYSESTAPTFVPDTNALIYNPALEEWDLTPGTVFEFVLTPTVLKELDSLKNGPSDRSRTQKAAQLVRQLKEYRGRGRLVDGVTLRRDRSVLVARMLEPHNSLDWLDLTISDHRFIASVLEIVKLRPAAPVAIVTRDIHMQTILELVGLRFVEPPDPAPTASGSEPSTPLGGTGSARVSVASRSRRA
jgi:hypothetical protein